MTGTACRHEPYECYRVSFPWPYAVTRPFTWPSGQVSPMFVRWSDDGDPPFPCLCTCSGCEDWRRLKAQVDGPVILPVA